MTGGQNSVRDAAHEWTEVLRMAEITIYCDAEYCRHNEDGFCLAGRVHINENGECTEVVKFAENENGGANNGKTD